MNHVHKEDGAIFLNDWVNEGWSSMFGLYTGYLHVVPRLMAAIAGSFPPVAYSFAVGVLVALWRMWLAYLAYWSLRSWGWGRLSAQLGAAMFVLVPVGQHEVLGNLTNERWVCDAAMVVLAVSTLRGWRAAAAAMTMVLCALSAPLGIVLIPFFVLGLWMNRTGGWIVPAAGLGGALLHGVMLTHDARGAFMREWVSDPAQGFGQLIVRGLEVAQFGVTGTMGAHRLVPWQIFALSAALPLLLLAACRGRRELALIASAGLLLAGAVAFTSPEALDVGQWYAVGQPSRYSYAPAILLSIAGVAAGRRLLAQGRKRLVCLSAAALIVAVGLDTRGDPRNAEGPTWPETVTRAQEECRADRGSHVAVRFTPTEQPKKWDATLPCDWFLR